MPILFPVDHLSFFPRPWLYDVYYAYPYPHPYELTEDGQDETFPVTCLCQEYSVCGCDDCSNNTLCTYLNLVLSNNSSVDVRIADVDGTRTVYINGTLENGTTAADPSAQESLSVTKFHLGGYWIVCVLVVSVIILIF